MLKALLEVLMPLAEALLSHPVLPAGQARGDGDSSTAARGQQTTADDVRGNEAPPGPTVVVRKSREILGLWEKRECGRKVGG